MAQKERLEQIRQLMRTNLRVQVTELAGELGVTTETIRRDLEKLEKEKFLTRTHGGAVLARTVHADNVSFLIRQKTHMEEKHRIAVLASSLIPQGASIGCDASSTCVELLSLLRDREDLLVLTNSAMAICDMSESKYRLLSTGGYVNRQYFSLQGGIAKNMLQEYHLDMVFMGCKGISEDGGIFDSHEFEIEMKRAMVEQGSRLYLLADHTKFGSIGFSKLADLGQVDTLITDCEPDPAWRGLLKELNVRVIYPE